METIIQEPIAKFINLKLIIPLDNFFVRLKSTLPPSINCVLTLN